MRIVALWMPVSEGREKREFGATGGSEEQSQSASPLFPALHDARMILALGQAAFEESRKKMGSIRGDNIRSEIGAKEDSAVICSIDICGRHFVQQL
jgi:hypothetical protein